MPKELINDSTQRRWHTEVSWRRRPGLAADDQGTASGHVQLASVNLDSPFEFPERERGDAWEAGDRFDGWRVTLDEAGIDRLIKTLHKAKNQAFGDRGEHDVRNVSTFAHYPQLRCVCPEHEGQPCYVTGEGISSQVSVTPGPEVTVESDATAAGRLDTDRYRAVRRGDR